MGRVVIVDPAYASSVGHHFDVNKQLLTAFARQGWTAECWTDEAISGAGCRGVFNSCGYVDQRHWADLGGMVHLAKQLERQLLDALQRQSGGACTQPVAGWVIHTVLPFQLLGLARALRHIPAATVVVSLMFPPGETLDSDVGHGAATTNCQVALSALARAVEQGSHDLRLELPSQQSLEIYAPLLAAAGLSCTGLHPAVVGAGRPLTVQPEQHRDAGTARPRILLHWGDLKPGKGRHEALKVVKQLVSGGPLPTPLKDADWLFHVHSQDPLPESELADLKKARERLMGFCWLKERVETGQMQSLLANCDVALLAYDPILYRQRSSGLLWCYGSARLRTGQPAAAVGRAGSWLEREARDLGLSWRSGDDGGWLEGLAAVLEQIDTAKGSNPAPYTAYGLRMLGDDFASHVAGLILEADQNQKVY